MKVLVVSNGPVPQGDKNVVEGGGLRCWGLAKGLAAHGHDVTIATNAVYGNRRSVVDGIRVLPYTLSPSFGRLVNAAEVVVVSYCMGQVTDYVIHSLSPQALLVGDAYVPIHVEVAAREADDVEEEQRHYFSDLSRWNVNLLRCDLLLVASPEQELYYTGLLAALGDITPKTYRTTKLLRTPFGIDPAEEPPAAKAMSPDRLDVLWFGGVYPWFNGDALVASVEEARDGGVPVNLTLAGASNPFVRHEHFEQHAADVVEAAKQAGHVKIVEWVPYGERGRVYEGADVLVTLNTSGPESRLSWRTRLVDYVWSGVPLLTNGGDPLAERLLAAGAAIRVHGNDSAALARAYAELWRDPSVLQRMREALRPIRDELAWENCTTLLANALREPETRLLPLRHAQRVAAMAAPAPGRIGQKVQAARWYSTRARRYAKLHGWKRTSVTAVQVVGGRLPRRVTHPGVHSAPTRNWVISHQLDNSGAPLVAVDIAVDAVRACGVGSTSLVAFPPIAENRVHDAREQGVDVVTLDSGLPAPRPQFNDQVVMNSLAVARHVVLDVLYRLENGRLSHAQWYVHEDMPEMWWDSDVARRVALLVEAGRLRLCAPSEGVKTSHEAYLGLPGGIEVVPYRLDLNERYLRQRTESDFSGIVFHLTGSAWDGRKGHATVLSAFQRLVLTHDVDDSRYRPFELHFNGLGTDFASEKLKASGRDILGDRFTSRAAASRDRALEWISSANVVLCDSVYEALPIYVLEGMAMGQLVLRNSCAGLAEQLDDGKNGWWIGDDHADTFVNALLNVLDRERTSDSDLARMSAHSREMVQRYLDADYEHFATWRPA